MSISGKTVKHLNVQPREYQLEISLSAYKKNTLVVLPTGLGKTVIALLVISKKLGGNQKDKILFLAPTKPLVVQHSSFLRENLKNNPVAVLTGEIKPAQREEIWSKNQVIVATPQIVENDLLSKKLSLKNVSLIVFDEAHHAIGNYPYVFISQMYKIQRDNKLVLALTASPGGDPEKILTICRNLLVENIEIRTEHDPDIKPYTQELEITWKKIRLPMEFSMTTQLLRKALWRRLEVLKKTGIIETSSPLKINKKTLLETQEKIQKKIRSNNQNPGLFQAAAAQSEAMKITHALELLQTQGVKTLLNYFQKIKKENNGKTSRSNKNLLRDNDIRAAINSLKTFNVEHPKLSETVKIIKQQLKTKKNSKIIVFTHYRDTSLIVTKQLEKEPGVKPLRFIGQTSTNTDKGLTQKEQNRLIEKFKKNKFNVLVATSVAEEGLDIPTVDLVVFYEPIPSEIRAIQRRGRTGRKKPGRVIILITQGTSDDGYYVSSVKKEKNMRFQLEKLRAELNKKLTREKKQFEKQINKKTQSLKTQILVDHREHRSDVVKKLFQDNVTIKTETLKAGDYVLSPRVGVERKTIEDFLNSMINRKLFKQALHLKNTYPRPIIIIEGSELLSKRNISQNAIFGCLASLTIDFGITVFTTKDSYETAKVLKTIAEREQRRKNKETIVRGEKTAMSQTQRQQFIIEGLPNVSSVLAKRLLMHFGTIKNIMNASQKELEKIKGIGKNKAQEIINILNVEYPEK